MQRHTAPHPAASRSPRLRAVTVALAGATIAGGLFVGACSADDPEPESESVVYEAQGRSFSDTSELDVNTPTSADSSPGAAPMQLAAGGGSVTGVDISKLAGVGAIDPDANADAAVEDLVTWRQLSLVGVDLDALLDYLFAPPPKEGEPAPPPSFEFPESIQALDGKEAAVIGYMIPLEFVPKTDDIAIFMLVRDLAACCFGGVPRPDEWIYVELPEGKGSDYFPYIPIVVRGTLKVGKLADDEWGFATGVYTLKATDVEEFKPKPRKAKGNDN